MPQILKNISFIPNDNNISIDKIISNSIENKTIDNILIIVPTGRQARFLKNKIIERYYDKWQMPVHSKGVYTLQSFALRLFNDLSDVQNFRFISDAYRMVLFEEAAEKSKLKFFAEQGKKIMPSVLKRIADVIIGLKDDGITIQNLKKDIDLHLSENEDELILKEIDLQRMKDVYSVYETYQNLLGNNLFDYTQMLNYLADKLNNENIKNFLPKVNLIYLQGFTQFKLPEIEFLTCFADSTIPFAINIDYILDDDYSLINGPLFGNIEETIIQLHKNGFSLHSVINHNEDSPDSRNGFLRRWLFNAEKEIRKADLLNNVNILACSNRLEEARAIVKLVNFLCNKENIKPNEICICSRQPQLYSHLFRELFFQFNIPSNITDRFDLANSPVIITIFSLLNLVIKGFRRDDFIRAFSSPYIAIDINNQVTKNEGTIKNINGSQNKEIDFMNLFDISANIRIQGGVERGGKNGWISRLDKLIKFRENLLTETVKNSTSDDFEIDKARSDINSLKKALDDFTTVTNIFSFTNNSYSVDEFIDIIKNKIVRKFGLEDSIFGIYKKIQLNSEKYSKNEQTGFYEKIESDGRALSAFLDLLDEFAFIMNERFPNLSLKLDEFTEKLKTAVSNAKYQIKEKQNYGVTVTSIEQIRGIPYKALILCGSVDSEFPLAYRTDTFLGKELPDSENKHLRAERIQFYEFLTNSSLYEDYKDKRFFITYPKYKETEELVRSPFIDALLKISITENINFFFDLAISGSENHTSMTNKNIEWYNYISNKNELIELLGNLNYANLSSNKKYKEQSEIIVQSFNISDVDDFLSDLINKKYINKIEGGILNLNNLSETIRENIINIKNRPFSISELETYAQCPFKYFASYLLKVKEKEVLDYTLTPLEIGNLLHKILFRFYSELQSGQYSESNPISSTIPLNGNNSINPVILEPSRKQLYLGILLNIARQELDAISFEHPFFKINFEEIMGYQDKPGMLEKWLVMELNKINSGWDFYPFLFELSFGSKSDKINNLVLANDLLIRGKIDRIELCINGYKLQFMIADYKTKFSNLPSNKDILKGTSFQMPLYILATENFLRSHFSLDAEPAGGVYYSFMPKYDKDNKKPEYFRFILLPPYNSLSSRLSNRTTSQKLSSDSDFDNYLEQSVNHAKNIIDKISNGIFPVEPLNNDSCKFCSYIDICRIKEKKYSLEFGFDDYEEE